VSLSQWLDSRGARQEKAAVRADAKNAAAFAEMDIPVFACTPDRFPDLMAAALAKKGLKLWAAAGRS
jgi:hypothetical protein